MKIGEVAAGAVMVVLNLGSVAPVQAQVQKLLQDSAIPPIFSRGQNVSVVERDRPELRPIGMPLGGFRLFPKVTVGGGSTDNVFQTTSDKKSDGYFNVDPDLTLRSQWARHSLSLNGRASLERYIDTTTRNQNAWSVNAVGRVDVGTQSSIDMSASTGRSFQPMFSGQAVAGYRTPLGYQESIFLLRGNYVGGRTRLIGAVDYSDYDFKNIETLAGVVVSQRGRNRQVWRTSGRGEYAISPDASIFVQTGYTDTKYPFTLNNGRPNRGSKDYTLLGGISFDVSALIRGSLGVGYTKRDYDAAIYKDSSGLSFEGKVEYFPSQLTTITLTGRRLIEDSALGVASGYYNTGGSVRIDHELLRNLLLRATADYEVDDYIGVSSKATVLRTSAGARYLMNRRVSLNFELSYGDRDRDGPLTTPDFSEVRSVAGVTFQL
ncbi:outer membrane beta-barrel protein [Sphingobium sp.]|uniref:outer membrane beta-barrel protein n=1 Tax=Sphingobium sp. TaxID=1912891 RepID=UPI003B3AC2F0